MKIWNRIQQIFQNEPIIIVSGLPRSGTSMMMKMLEVGGLQILTDYERQADDDNPKGYYEFERVKKLREADTDWLPAASGKVVKIISALLEYLPGKYQYRVIFMQRAIVEVLASQNKMLVNRGEATDKVSDQEMARLYEQHLAKVESWLEKQPNFKVLYVDYNQMVKEPTIQIEQLSAFLEADLNTSKMVAVIDPDLYRQRQAEA